MVPDIPLNLTRFKESLINTIPLASGFFDQQPFKLGTYFRLK